MRIALNIHTHNDKATLLDLFPATDLSGNPDLEPVRLFWDEDKSRLEGVSATNLDARFLMKAVQQAIGEDKPATTPFAVVRALIAAGATQVVWDAAAKKYRNLSTAKDGADTWELLGVKGLTVDADDEAGAVQRANRLIADTMAQNPAKAAELVAFFSGGSKVKKVASGKVPEAIKPEALASNDAEKVEAAKPVAVKPSRAEKRKAKKAQATK